MSTVARLRTLAWTALLTFAVAVPGGAWMAAAQTAPTTEEKCEVHARDLRSIFEAQVAHMWKEHNTFEARQQAESGAFAKGNHSSDESAAFKERQAQERKAFYSQMWTDYQNAWAAKAHTYRSDCGDYEPQAWKGWVRPEPPVPPEHRTAWSQPPTGASTAPPAKSPPPDQTSPPPTAEPRPAYPPPTEPACPAPGSGAYADGTTTYQSSDGRTTCTYQRYDKPPPEPSRNHDDGACRAYEAELRAEHDRHMGAIAEEKQAFAAQQARERDAWAQEQHTEEESRAFGERQAQAAFQKAREWQQRLDAHREQLMAKFHARCGGPSQAPVMGAAPEPAAREACGRDVQAWEHERIQFERDMQAKREAFEGAWRERWQAWQSDQRTPEEWSRFKEEAAAARLAFEEDMRRAFDAWHREHAPPAMCGGPVVVRDSGCDPERMRLEARELERHLRERYFGVKEGFDAFHQQMQAKMESFQKEQRLRREAFMASNHTEEDRASFEERERQSWDSFLAGMEAERRALEERMRAHQADVEAKVRAEMEQFMRSQAERCFGPREGPRDAPASPHPAEPGRATPAPPPTLPSRAYHDDTDQRRVACMLEVRIQMQDFESQQLRDLRQFLSGDHGRDAMERFELTQHEARRAFEERLHGVRATCEEQFHERYAVARAEMRRDSKPVERMGSFQMEEDPAKGEGRVRGAHVSFSGDMSTEAIYGYTVGGQLFLDAIRKSTPFTDFRMSEEGGSSVMEARGEGLMYRFHDNPNGLVNFRVERGTIELDVADYLKVEQRDGRVTLVDGGRRAAITGDGLKVEGDRITVTGKANFIVDGHKQEVLDKVANRHRDDIAAAVKEKKVAAEVTVVKDDRGVKAERLTYEDMAITIEPPKAQGQVSVRIDNPAHEGKTVVLNLDKGLLASLSGVQVKVFEVEGASERDARPTKASSLADVLDPKDDQGIEYWMVTDEDGLQVLVSFPHFSEKRVEIQSMSAGSKLVPGFDGFAVLGAIGAAMLLLRRRA